MGMTVTNGPVALATHRTLLRTTEAQSRSIERLTTGLRVNRAADDAAGLTIAESLRSQGNGLTVAIRNVRDGISLLQVADGALAGSSALLHRMRDLAVQGANDGALDDAARSAVQLEMAELATELTRIGRTTAFNGTPLLDGNYRGTFQVGAAAGETVTVVIGGRGAGIDTTGLGLDGLDVTASSTSVSTTVTPAVSAEQGAPLRGRIEFHGDFVTPGVLENNFRALTGTLTYDGKTLDLSTVDYGAAVTGQEFLNAITAAAMPVFGTVHTPFTATAGALAFDGEVPGAGSVVGSLRAELGAISNRFEHTIARLGIATGTTTASMGRILDADMAEEVMRLSSSEVLAQSGTAMLAQVGSSGQYLLRLLN
jgi:flagellin-like hook-associated protein FlgL